MVERRDPSVDLDLGKAAFALLVSRTGDLLEDAVSDGTRDGKDPSLDLGIAGDALGDDARGDQ
jgi:hypothetical protein